MILRVLSLKQAIDPVTVRKYIALYLCQKAKSLIHSLSAERYGTSDRIREPAEYESSKEAALVCRVVLGLEQVHHSSYS